MADTELDNDDGMESHGLNGSARHRSRSPMRKSRSRSRSPREWRRGERNRNDDRDRERRRPVREDHRGKVRLYVCNMPYDVSWQLLKDSFKKELGSAVTYVEMFENPDGKSCGAAVVEIKGKENAEKAIEKFDRTEMKGRKIIVREERDKDRTRHHAQSNRDMGGDMRGGGGGPGGNMNMGIGGGMNMGGAGGGGMNMGASNMNMGGGGLNMGGPSGISSQILQQLNIDPNHVTNQVFIANLDYKVSARKVRDIFKMAGTVVDVELKEDQDGKSRGMAVVKFEHPIEAVQAISMFNGQMLYERNMTVKMDKLGDSSYAPQQIPNKLPSGLQGIGMGLGSGGAPVNMQQLGGIGMMGGNTGGMMGGNLGGGMSNPMGGMGTPSNMGASSMGMTAPGMGMNNMGSMPSMSPMGGSIPTMGGLGGMNAPTMGGMNTNMGPMTSMPSSISGGMGDMSGMQGSSLGSMGGASMSSDLGGGMGSNMPMGAGMGGGGMQPSMGGGGMDRGYSSGVPPMGGGGGMPPMGGNGGGPVNMEATTVFVRNLPFSVAWQDLKQRFMPCGEVKFAEIKMENGRSKGYGTVKFLTPEDARRAVDMMNGVRIDGRQVEVRLNRV